MMSYQRERIIPAQPEKTVTDELMSVMHNIGLNVIVTYRTMCDGVLMGTKNHVIGGDAYQLLLSEAPAWDNLKPAGRFRDEDLMAIIDQLESA